MDFLTNPTYIFWIAGFVALGAYWLMKPKGDEAINVKNIALSVLLVFLGLALGAFLYTGPDAAGLQIAYAVSTGLAGGTTVKTVADRKAGK